MGVVCCKELTVLMSELFQMMSCSFVEVSDLDSTQTKQHQTCKNQWVSWYSHLGHYLAYGFLEDHVALSKESSLQGSSRVESLWRSPVARISY